MIPETWAHSAIITRVGKITHHADDSQTNTFCPGVNLPPESHSTFSQPPKNQSRRRACLFNPAHSTISTPSLRIVNNVEEVRTNKGNNLHSNPIPANSVSIHSSFHHVQARRQSPPIIHIRRGKAIDGGLNYRHAISNRHRHTE